MRLVLAPMEGVVDDLMRDILSTINPFDLVVTEFVRVVDQLLPEKVYYKLCPELHNDGLTPNGTPVRVQLLGQEPNWMAENAFRAVELGSRGVEANFGCPAKIVNRSKGGAVLLQYPDNIHNIVKAMRQAVPAHQPVTAKIRLGYEDKSLFMENKTGKYFKYAIGEIILVVIGILIALSINNWNENRKTSNTQEKYKICLSANIW